MHPPVAHAARDQDSIGIFGLLVGHFASPWTHIQEHHYQMTSNQCSAALWSVLCQQLLQMTHNLWTNHNQAVLQAQQQVALATSCQEIIDQFNLGLQHLLPEDHFYVLPGPQGFTLDQIFALPLEDQQLWLQAIHNACIAPWSGTA